MKTDTGVTGIDEVMNNLNREVKRMGGASVRGLILAFIEIRRSMEKESPKIPIEFGNLRSSWFVVTSTGQVAETKEPSFKGEDAGRMAADHATVKESAQAEATVSRFPLAIGGFSANYAIWVHENVGANFTGPRPGARSPARRKAGRPGAGAKFYEAALKRNQEKILRILFENVKIKD